MSEREFRSLLLKMISDLQEDSNKQINEVGESIQDIDKTSATWREIQQGNGNLEK
jgi:hypothetical protein